MLKLSQVFKYMTKLALNKKELQDLIAFRKLDDITDPKYMSDPSLIPENKPIVINPKELTRAVLYSSEDRDSSPITKRIGDIYSSGFKNHRLFKNKVEPKLLAQGKDPSAIPDVAAILARNTFKKIIPYKPEVLTQEKIEKIISNSEASAANYSISASQLKGLLRQKGIEIDKTRPGADVELSKDLDTIMEDVRKKSPIMYIGEKYREPGKFMTYGQPEINYKDTPFVSSKRLNIDNILESSDDINSTMDMFTNMVKLHESSESRSRNLGLDPLNGNDLVNYIVKNPGSLYSTLSNTGGHAGQQAIEDLALIANLTGPGSEAARKAMAQMRRVDIAGMQKLLGATNKNNLRTNLMLNHATLIPSILDPDEDTAESADFNNILGKYFANDISSNKQFNEKLKQLAISKGLIRPEGSLSDIAAGSTLADSIKAKIKPETLKGIVQSLGPTRMSSEARNILYKNLDLAAASPTMQSKNIADIPAGLEGWFKTDEEDPSLPRGGIIGSGLGLLAGYDDDKVGGNKNYIPYMPISTPSQDVSKGEVITNAIKDSLKAAPLEPLKRSIAKL